MSLTKFGLSRPIVVRMALILIIVAGIYCYNAMPRYLDPDLTIGEGFILTVCPGFSPEEMEKLVTNKIEDELDGISNIRKIESNSFESTSNVHVFFNTELSEYEIDQGMQEIRNAVDQVNDLPETADAPFVQEIDVAIFPSCMVGLAGDLPMMQLQDIAEDIAETLESIDGVSEVEVIGKRDNEIWVELNPRSMSSYGISVSQVARAIANRSRNLPGGAIEMGEHETAIRMLGEPKKPEDLGEIVLKSVNGGAVYLRDIARIKPTLEKPVTQTFIDNKKALVLGVKRKRNTNVIQIVDDVKELIKDVPSEYPGLKTTLYFDQSREIKRRIHELQGNAFIGVIFVFIILWVSMGLRNAVYASIGIPVSFLITFIFMKCFNLSIDGLSLFALILVLGIIVDDAIVVLENIFRHLEKGSPIFTATLEGSREVLAPILASVSTTMAAFFPILIVVGGVVGRFLEILPQIVIFALVASVFEVFFMLPSHIAELTPKDHMKKRLKGRFDIFSPLRKIYYPLLRSILRHRYLSVLVIVASMVLAIGLFYKIDFVPFPKSDAFPRFNIYFDLPVGSTLERTKNLLLPLSDLIRKRIGPDLDAPIAIAGMKEINYAPFFGKHYGMLNVILKAPGERKHSVVDLMEGVRKDVETLLYSNGATSMVMERMLEGPPVGADLDLKIQSGNWETSATISRLIREELAKHEGIVDIQDSYSKEKQFMEITVDETRAKQVGIDQNDLTMAVQAAFHGMPVATYNQGDEEQEIKLKYQPEYTQDFDDLLNMKVVVPAHGEIPLKELATVQLTPGFHNIFHYNGQQTVRLNANIKEIKKQEEEGFSDFWSGFFSSLRGDNMTSMKANTIAMDCYNRIKANFPGARMSAGGLKEDSDTLFRDLATAAIMAFCLIFFILALQFNSFTQPFIIMSTIPFVTLGVMVGLLLSNNPLTFITIIGLLTLTGIVVNDSLVLIDFINRYRKEHPNQLYLAIIRGCNVRMRPIILTSLTTIFGLAPMAFGLGGKSVMWAPMATAIMWGLGFGTILILSMVPAYYAILADITYFFRHRNRRKADTSYEIEKAFQHEDLIPFMKKL